MRWSDAPGHLADNLSDTTNKAFIPDYYPLLHHHMRSARYTGECAEGRLRNLDQLGGWGGGVILDWPWIGITKRARYIFQWADKNFFVRHCVCKSKSYCSSFPINHPWEAVNDEGSHVWEPFFPIYYSYGKGVIIGLYEIHLRFHQVQSNIVDIFVVIIFFHVNTRSSAIESI